MHAHTRSRQGFTLVEILIVVVILGILAAIVIPQFTSASEDARASSLVSQLQTIRSQLELYRVQNGEYPQALGTNWDEMTTTASGNGPYLQQPPRNPFGENDASVNQVSGATAPDFAANTDWSYNSDTGQIRANVGLTQDQADELNLSDQDVNIDAG
ncbi:MAG: prepilin-type N-terminal cleavage/methylation domain-containing protein [Phycisphaeraceae bacterium]